MCCILYDILTESSFVFVIARERALSTREGGNLFIFLCLTTIYHRVKMGKLSAFFFRCFGRSESEESTHVTVFRSLTIFIDIFFLSFKVSNIGNDDVSESENVER